MSRNPVLGTFKNDENCEHDYIGTKHWRSESKLKLHQEFKKVIEDGHVCFKKLKSEQRIFVSKMYGIWLIKKIHEYCGHIGRYQLIEKMKSHYYFKKYGK